MGMAENRFVITVAPQNDICPHGSTYPRKAAAIVATISTIPEDHTAFFFLRVSRSRSLELCVCRLE
jgi:hypothetical protein